MKVVLLASLFGSLALGDVYLHSVRGANNRLDEANRDRANGNVVMIHKIMIVVDIMLVN